MQTKFCFNPQNICQNNINIIVFAEFRHLLRILIGCLFKDFSVLHLDTRVQIKYLNIPHRLITLMFCMISEMIMFMAETRKKITFLFIFDLQEYIRINWWLAFTKMSVYHNLSNILSPAIKCDIQFICYLWELLYTN